MRSRIDRAMSHQGLSNHSQGISSPTLLEHKVRRAITSLPNARHQARQTAGARHERTLFAVACMPWFGQAVAMRRDQTSLPPRSVRPTFPAVYRPAIIQSATRSAIIIVVALVLALTTSGITEASTTRSPSSPCTQQY